MPYVPPELKERIKREVSIQRLAEARGIKLRRSGKELIGLCPFHEDTNPSLNIDPVEKRLGLQGRVRRRRRRHPVGDAGRGRELPSRDGTAEAGLSSLRQRQPKPPPKNLTVPKLPPLFEHTADDKSCWESWWTTTTRRSKQSPEAQHISSSAACNPRKWSSGSGWAFANRTLDCICRHEPRSPARRSADA